MMKKIVSVFIIFTLLIASGFVFLNKKPYINYYYSIDDYIEGLYFPEKIVIDELKNDSYSRHLSNLEEPVIFIQNDQYKTIYRFTCLRTFHNPFSIRIEIDEQEEAAVLFFKMSNGMTIDISGGFDLGDLTINEQRTLEHGEIDSITDAIEKYNYWEMPFAENKPSGGRDGSNWIIEILKDGKYHAISRWSPTFKEQYEVNGSDYKIVSLNRILDLDAVYELGLFFIELSKQEIEELY